MQLNSLLEIVNHIRGAFVEILYLTILWKNSLNLRRCSKLFQAGWMKL